jgi:hypothetical protein
LQKKTVRNRQQCRERVILFLSIDLIASSFANEIRQINQHFVGKCITVYVSTHFTSLTQSNPNLVNAHLESVFLSRKFLFESFSLPTYINLSISHKDFYTRARTIKVLCCNDTFIDHDLYVVNIPFAISFLFSTPYNTSPSCKLNANAVAGPCDVIKLPLTTTSSSETVTPVFSNFARNCGAG